MDDAPQWSSELVEYGVIVLEHGTLVGVLDELPIGSQPSRLTPPSPHWSRISPAQTLGVSFPDKDWRERIDRTKRARQEARTA